VRLNLQLVVACCLCPGPARIDRGGLPMDYIAVESVFHVRRLVGAPKDRLVVRLVAGDEDGHRLVSVQPSRTDLGVLKEDSADAREIGNRPQGGDVDAACP